MTADGDEDNDGIVAFDDDELADMFSFGIEASESMISTELEISMRTVDRRRSVVLEKMEVDSAPELARLVTLVEASRDLIS